MKNATINKTLKLIAPLFIIGALTACTETMGRLAEVGKGPELSKITNPTAKEDYRPVSMPSPTPQSA